MKNISLASHYIPNLPNVLPAVWLFIQASAFKQTDLNITDDFETVKWIENISNNEAKSVLCCMNLGRCKENFESILSQLTTENILEYLQLLLN